jgi:hypothetical protein
MELKWPAPDPPTVSILKLRIACTAFANDTAWISHDKTQMDRIIKISSSFYSLNNIRINGEKSELIVINKKNNNSTNEQQPPSIRLGNDNTLLTANSPNKASRYLGIFIRSRKSTKHVIDLLTQEVRNIVAVL